MPTPDPHLPSVFDIQVDELTPITEIKELIEKRTGKDGGFIRLNPEVADIPEKYGLKFKGVKLLVLGSKKGDDGCYCRENVLVKRLLEHLLAQDKTTYFHPRGGNGVLLGKDNLKVCLESLNIKPKLVICESHIF